MKMPSKDTLRLALTVVVVLLALDYVDRTSYSAWSHGVSYILMAIAVVGIISRNINGEYRWKR